MICIQVNLGLKTLTVYRNFCFDCYEIDDHLNEKLTDFIRLDYKHDSLTYKR